jgi:hypothetical protein
MYTQLNNKIKTVPNVLMKLHVRKSNLNKECEKIKKIVSKVNGHEIVHAFV